MFVGGAVIQWLRDELGMIHDFRDSEYFATKVESSQGVYVVPAFAGLGAPYWDMNARGTITGLTRGTNLNHIIRASLESIAYQTQDLLSAMRQDTDTPLTSLRVDGGAASNNFLMQFQADISDTAVIRLSTGEATAMGAAFLAGLAVGFWKDRAELLSLCREGGRFEPSLDEEERKNKLEGWRKAVAAAQISK